MKKYIVLFVAVLLLAACSSKDETNNGEEAVDVSSEEQINNEENKDPDQKMEQEDKIYQIGETAVITSDLSDFDYEVTVNDFQITDEVDGESIFDYVLGLEEDDPTRFAVVDVTIKNISDESYVPSEMFSANLSESGEEAGDVSEDEFFPEGDEELAPEDEVSGHLVYTIYLDDEIDGYWLKYEILSDQETIFELPKSE